MLQMSRLGLTHPDQLQLHVTVAIYKQHFLLQARLDADSTMLLANLPQGVTSVTFSDLNPGFEPSGRATDLLIKQ
jgi:hypothetical protein